jgi:hypothetical protein
MNQDTMSEQQNALSQFRALVMADEALADSLSQTVDADHFLDLVMQRAGARGLTLAEETIHAQLLPDPLGLARWTAGPVSGSIWPSRHWLPIQVTALDNQLHVDWAHFGARALTEPFFEGSIRRALSRPFNRMFRYRMTLDDFMRHASGVPNPGPSGFIFHMSRCGSTLVSQVLAALPHTIMISEAAPVDAIVQLSRVWSDLPAERHVEHLVAMLAVLGRRRNGAERHIFVKLDSWHALALPLFRRAFPSVPWVFLYREPVEVLVSQMRQRGMQMVAEFMSPRLYGIDDADGMRAEDYCARVLNRICTSVIDNCHHGGGLLVNYRELPDAIWSRILPHFGVVYSDDEREAASRIARYDAKSPDVAFTNDTAAKQRAATDQVRAAAERQLGDIYRRLEGLRTGGA